MFKRIFEEYKKFIMRGNVIDLAVAVVIGTAFQKVVSALVESIFMPFLSTLTGGWSVMGLSFKLYGNAVFHVGFFLQALIDFLIIGFCMFLVVKAMNLMMKKEPPPPPEPTPSEKLLAEIRDLLKDGK
ncbi:MAG TPA: large conductance mechanosensitive channel protein MscL [Fimbriiglobus sp.]